MYRTISRPSPCHVWQLTQIDTVDYCGLLRSNSDVIDRLANAYFNLPLPIPGTCTLGAKACGKNGRNVTMSSSRSRNTPLPCAATRKRRRNHLKCSSWMATLWTTLRPPAVRKLFWFQFWICVRFRFSVRAQVRKETYKWIFSSTVALHYSSHLLSKRRGLTETALDVDTPILSRFQR